MKKKSKWIWSGIFLSIFLIIIIAFFFHTAILFHAGKFMAPEGDYEADVAILEGSDYVSTGMVVQGLNLLSSGKVKRLVIVLHRIARLHRPYGLNTDYANLVRKELQDHGLKETDFKIIETPVRNPVTLTAARMALDALSRENVKRNRGTRCGIMSPYSPQVCTPGEAFSPTNSLESPIKLKSFLPPALLNTNLTSGGKNTLGFATSAQRL